jgi:hypothetical protein
MLLQRGGGVEPRSEVLYPSIQSADDCIEWAAFKCFGEELRQFSKCSIAYIEIERSASNSEHPAVKAMLAQLPSEARRQMYRSPNDLPGVVPRIVMRAPAHQGNLGKWRSKQVAADAG